VRKKIIINSLLVWLVAEGWCWFAAAWLLMTDLF
jgi:hypothetical protein